MGKYFPGVEAGGRGPSDLKRVKNLAARHSDEAIETLAAIMRDSGEDGRVRVAAAQALLDRAHGKPGQSLEVEATATVVHRLATAPEELHARLAAAVEETGRVGEGPDALPALPSRRD